MIAQLGDRRRRISAMGVYPFLVMQCCLKRSSGVRNSLFMSRARERKRPIESSPTHSRLVSAQRGAPCAGGRRGASAASGVFSLIVLIWLATWPPAPTRPPSDRRRRAEDRRRARRRWPAARVGILRACVERDFLPVGDGALDLDLVLVQRSGLGRFKFAVDRLAQLRHAAGAPGQRGRAGPVRRLRGDVAGPGRRTPCGSGCS